MKKVIMIFLGAQIASGMETKPEKSEEKALEVTHSTDFDKVGLETPNINAQTLAMAVVKADKNKKLFAQSLQTLHVLMNCQLPSEKLLKHDELTKFFYQLSLRGNEIANLSSYVKDAVRYWVGMSGGKLSDSHIYFLNHMHLRILDLSHNKLTKLPKVLEGVQTLTALNATHNLFTEIPPVIYALQQLEEIKLSHNKITYIDEGGLLGLKKLKLIDVSHNELRSIPNNFMELPMLGYCDLHRNQIKGTIKPFFKTRPQIFFITDSPKKNKHSERKKVNSFFEDEEENKN